MASYCVSNQEIEYGRTTGKRLLLNLPWQLPSFSSSQLFSLVLRKLHFGSLELWVSITAMIQAYNRLFGSQSTGLGQRLQDLPFLLKRLFRELMDPQRSLPFVIKARVFLALISTAIYVLSPVDIIPEALFGVLGLLDDVIIALIFFLHVGTLYRAILVRRYGGP
ncbi:hypothetical protein L1987_53547 [Smallanthus sonchifolius]|uniref:Uncharacterized protein n=1 Tax=Smallanthus sonchifolius TaxID=185202 RepID=A0ACB9EW84_9ASTR|nr:hypothetical protein L1987_53547 [Smallanthus sonchifolius]